MPNDFQITGDSVAGTYRTTEELVRAIGGFPNDLDLEPFIATANLLVNDVENTNASCLSPTKLELIERWLSAHYAKILSPSVTSKSIAGASASFEGRSSGGQGLSLTSYGQQAMALDCSGYLRNLDKPVVSMAWLGTIS